MTSTRYFIARFAQAFGYYRKNQRMGEAAAEMHLLREAEAQLGAYIWEKVEGIEELSVEYWNLRKFIKERDTIKEKLALCQSRLDQAHEERSMLLSRNPQVHQELFDQRAALLSALEKLAQQRDEIIIQAREVRRNYEGLKMKLEVLTHESADSGTGAEEIQKVKARLHELRAKFSELKEKRLRVGQQIEDGDAKVDLVEAELKEKKMDRRVSASEAFQVIGDGNREISLLRAENGVLDTQMRQLYAEIGRYVSRNTQHPGCAAAAASHQGLVDVMRAIRRSIALNHRLAGIS